MMEKRERHGDVPVTRAPLLDESAGGLSDEGRKIFSETDDSRLFIKKAWENLRVREGVGESM